MNMNNIEQIKTKCDANVESLYKSISQKMPMWVLFPFLAILLSILALQWGVLNSMTVIHKSLAVLEYKVDRK